jgi:hypothetical protein
VKEKWCERKSGGVKEKGGVINYAREPTMKE